MCVGGGGRGGDQAGSAPAVPGKWVSNTGGLTTPEKGGGGVAQPCKDNSCQESAIL